MNGGIGADAGFKAQEGMQSLVAENFMGVVGTHICCAKVQKITHFPGGSRPFSVRVSPIFRVDRIFSIAARIFTIPDRVLGIGYRVLSIFGK